MNHFLISVSSVMVLGIVLQAQTEPHKIYEVPQAEITYKISGGGALARSQVHYTTLTTN